MERSRGVPSYSKSISRNGGGYYQPRSGSPVLSSLNSIGGLLMQTFSFLSYDDR